MVDEWGQGGVADKRPLADEGRDAFSEPLVDITQWVIAEYLSLQEQHNRFERLKEQLKRSLEAGAAVEPGPWRLELEVREQRALTAAAIIEALGLSDEQVRRLKASVPARTLRYLVVCPDSGSG